MIRSVPTGGGAKANAFARAGEPPRIDQSIQLGHLRRRQNVVEHQIALKIEQVLLQLPVRSATVTPSRPEHTGGLGGRHD